MHRIDTSTATPAHLFTDGDPLTGTPATVVSDDWCNAVQEEICAVVEGAGIGLSKPANDQLKAAIAKMINAAVPTGTVLQGYFAVVPAGYLALDGSLVSRAAYAGLWAFAQAGGLVVAEATWSASAWTLFGAGDGATTFRLPDLRGEFVRGWDAGRGVDAGRALGSRQADELRSHTHSVTAHDSDEGGPNYLGGSNDADAPQAVATTAAGGTETRPRNAALRYLIRA
jgi:microcystin-dependent protein